MTFPVDIKTFIALKTKFLQLLFFSNPNLNIKIAKNSFFWSGLTHLGLYIILGFLLEKINFTDKLPFVYFM
jgi:hypothetical protein